MSDTIRAVAEAFVAEYSSKSPGAFRQDPRMVTSALVQVLRSAGHDAFGTFGCYRGLPDGFLPEDHEDWSPPERQAYLLDPWEVHHWAVCEGIVIDICSCRFLPEPAHLVVMADVDDPRYRYS